jgi:hypothetical protein
MPDDPDRQTPLTCVECGARAGRRRARLASYLTIDEEEPAEAVSRQRRQRSAGEQASKSTFSRSPPPPVFFAQWNWGRSPLSESCHGDNATYSSCADGWM